jgi:hypothetical protein
MTTTIALAPRTAPSLYSGMLLALIALAFALQASFLASLAVGRGAFAGPQPGAPAPTSTMTASLPLPCATNP